MPTWLRLMPDALFWMACIISCFQFIGCIVAVAAMMPTSA